MPTDQRRDRGALGERIATAHLERRGYAIVDRNYRTRWGELDLVACDERALVFVEVKTRRAGSGAPFDAITAAKRLRVRRMVSSWLGDPRPRPHRRDIRIDAIGVTIDARGEMVALDHVEAAF
jgi:putative endonuclease